MENKINVEDEKILQTVVNIFRKNEKDIKSSSCGQRIVVTSNSSCIFVELFEDADFIISIGTTISLTEEKYNIVKIINIALRSFDGRDFLKQQWKQKTFSVREEFKKEQAKSLIVCLDSFN